MRVQSRTARKRRQDMLGIALLLVSLIGAAALGLAYWLTTPEAVDPVTMCPVIGPEGLTVLLIDATDSLTALQSASLHNHFDRVVGSVPKRAAVEIFTVDHIGTDLLHRTGERLCNPGNKGSFLTQNPRLIERRWHEAFWGPLQQWVEQAIGHPSAPESPILESLQSIAVTEFQALQFRGKPRTLVIASDMLQNTAGLSQYHNVEQFDHFLKTDYYKAVRTDWTGVNIEILYIARSGTPQGRQHVEFWQGYFAASGGTVVHVTSL